MDTGRDRYRYRCQCDKYNGEKLGRVEKQGLPKSWGNLREKIFQAEEISGTKN